MSTSLVLGPMPLSTLMASRRESSSAFCASAFCCSDFTARLQPVSLQARRMFCPSRPMVSASWSLGTMISAWCAALSRMRTELDLAGAIEFAMKVAVSSDQGMRSMRSPESSFMMVRMREPRMPTQAPTGSTLGLFDFTTILERKPGSRAMSRISTTFSPTSGTSISKRRRMKREAARESTTCGPRWALSTFRMTARMRSPTL